MGVFGENYPYTNFHNLNMDWIIKIAKDFLDQYTQIQDIITNGEQSLQTTTQEGIHELTTTKEHLENLLDQWYLTHSADIANQLASALAEFQRSATAFATEVISSIPQDYQNVWSLLSAVANMNKTSLFNNWNDGHYYGIGNSVTNKTYTDTSAEETLTCGYVACSPGDIFRITGRGASSGRLYAWTKANGDIISRAEANYSATNEKIIAPDETAYLLVNTFIADAHALVSGDLDMILHADSLALDTRLAYIIPNNTDIDSLVTSGNYRCNSSASASTMPHAPTTSSGFKLAVMELTLADRIMQIAYIPNGTTDPTIADIKYRIKIGSAEFLPWKIVADHRYTGLIGSIRSLADFENNTNLYSALTYDEGMNQTADVIGKGLMQYRASLAESAIGRISYPVKTRDFWGNPLASIKWSFDTTGSARFALGFDRDGFCIARYQYSDLLNAPNGIPADAYYMCFIQYTNVASTANIFKNTYIVDINGSGDFTSFTACLLALKDNTDEKTIHVMGGEYDIFTEMGGQTFLNSITGNEMWYDVSVMIPPNTTIIGHGIVEFKMLLPDNTPANKAILLSPVNVRGSATLKNIRVTAYNCRYCIHPEGSKDVRFDNSRYIFENVICENLGTVTSGSTAPVACGLNKGVFFELTNCVFKTVGNSAFSIHDQAIEYDLSPCVVFNSCVFDAQNYAIVMASTKRENMAQVIDVRLFNCYAGNLFMRKTSNSNAENTKDCFRAWYINTPHRTQNSAQLVNIIPDIDYNNFQ